MNTKKAIVFLALFSFFIATSTFSALAGFVAETKIATPTAQSFAHHLKAGSLIDGYDPINYTFEQTLYGSKFSVHALYQMAAKKISPSLVLQAIKYGKSVQAHYPNRLICEYPQENVVVVIEKGCGGKILNVGFSNELAHLNTPAPTKEQKETQEKIDKALEEAIAEDVTNLGTRTYRKPGDCNNAMKDFDSMKLVNIKKYPKGTVVGELPDGTRVNARCDSDDGRPTLEIQISGKKIKIRYGAKK